MLLLLCCCCSALISPVQLTAAPKLPAAPAPAVHPLPRLLSTPRTTLHSEDTLAAATGPKKEVPHNAFRPPQRVSPLSMVAQTSLAMEQQIYSKLLSVLSRSSNASSGVVGVSQWSREVKIPGNPVPPVSIHSHSVFEGGGGEVLAAGMHGLVLVGD